MNLETYPVKSRRDKRRFEFVSKGVKGRIRKIVLFQKLERNVYNLAFGDWDKKKRIIDSQTRSNNGDRDKVLATVNQIKIYNLIVYCMRNYKKLSSILKDFKGSITDSDDMIDYDFENDPVLKAKAERAKDNLKRNPLPERFTKYNSVANKKRKRKK